MSESKAPPKEGPFTYAPTLRERIDDLIRQELGAERIRPETRLCEDIGADSLDVTELAIALEEEFELPEIPNELIDGFISVQDIYSYIEEQVKA